MWPQVVISNVLHWARVLGLSGTLADCHCVRPHLSSGSRMLHEPHIEGQLFFGGTFRGMVV
jgi:hypothetical protein